MISKLETYFLYLGDDDDEMDGAGGKDWGDLGKITHINRKNCS